MSDLPPERPKAFVTASHTILFEEDPQHCCDVCGDALKASTQGDDEGYDVEGRGLYVWTRGEERRSQEPPLCSACAAAIGVSALSRWEIEEDEG